MVSSKHILADVGKFVGRERAVNESVKQKESGRKFSEDSLKYRGKFLKTLKLQVVPEVGNSYT